MSLLFNMLSRLVIVFLPRSKRLSWWHSPPAVIWEPKKLKSFAISFVSPSICYEVMGLDAMCIEPQKNVSHSVCMSSWGWSRWCSCLSSHTRQAPSPQAAWCYIFTFKSFVLLLSLFKMAPKCGAEVQSGVAKFNRGMLCLTEKIYVLDKLHSLNPMSYRVVGCEFNVSESTILFFKVSLNTHKENKGSEQLCIDQSMKILWPEAYRNLTVVPLGTVVQYSVTQWFSTFQKVTTTNNRNQVYLIGVSRENRENWCLKWLRIFQNWLKTHVFRFTKYNVSQDQEKFTCWLSIQNPQKTHHKHL